MKFLPAFLRRKPARLPAFGVEDIRPKFYSDSQAERDRARWDHPRQDYSHPASDPLAGALDGEDFPGSTMVPPPFGKREECRPFGGAISVVSFRNPAEMAREINRLSPPPRTSPAVSLHPEGLFVVIRDRVADVYDPRMVPAAYVVEDTGSEPDSPFILGHLLDRNGTPDLDNPAAVDAYSARPWMKEGVLAKIDARRVLARFHTFDEAAYALDAARTAWVESNDSPMARAVTTLSERVQTARADLQRAHAEADGVRDRMTEPFVTKLAEIVAARQEAALEHVAQRDRAVMTAIEGERQ